MGGVRGESGGVTIPICQQKGVLASDAVVHVSVFPRCLCEMFFTLAFLDVYVYMAT